MKHKLQIPTSFELGGRTWKVIPIVTPELADAHSTGQCCYDFTCMKIYKTNHGHAMNHEVHGVSYLHELFHAMLFETNYNDLSNDENFVDRMAKALYQVLTTSEGQISFKEKT